MPSLAAPFSKMKKTSTVFSALIACIVTKSGSPAPIPMMRIFFTPASKQNPLDKPNGTRDGNQDRQDLGQARQPTGPRQPDHRRHDEGNEGELAELDADVESDQRPH